MRSISKQIQKGGLKDIVHKARTSFNVDQISKYALDIAKVLHPLLTYEMELMFQLI